MHELLATPGGRLVFTVLQVRIQDIWDLLGCVGGTGLRFEVVVSLAQHIYIHTFGIHIHIHTSLASLVG